MKAHRHYISIGIASAALLLAAVASAAAQEDPAKYPSRPIHIVVGFTPGGGNDLIARIVGQKLSEDLGQPVIIDNKPGAGAIVATEYVAKSAPDGYTLLVGASGAMSINPAVYAKLSYDPVRDFIPISELGSFPLILIVNASSPFKSVAELVAYAKANPGKLTFAHTGPGGLPHMTGELFNALAGVDLLGVSYKSGGESVAAVLGHQVDMTFETVTILLPLIRDGKLRALAITSRERTPLAPDLPTMIEAGVPNYEVTSFNGIVAPAGTPAPVVNLLNKTINEGLQTPENKNTIAHLGAISNPGSPQEFAAFIAAQHRKWLQVAKSAHISVD